MKRGRPPSPATLAALYFAMTIDAFTRSDVANDQGLTRGEADTAVRYLLHTKFVEKERGPQGGAGRPGKGRPIARYRFIREREREAWDLLSTPIAANQVGPHGKPDLPARLPTANSILEAAQQLRAFASRARESGDRQTWTIFQAASRAVSALRYTQGLPLHCAIPSQEGLGPDHTPPSVPESAQSSVLEPLALAVETMADAIHEEVEISSWAASGLEFDVSSQALATTEDFAMVAHATPEDIRAAIKAATPLATERDIDSVAPRIVHALKTVRELFKHSRDER